MLYSRECWGALNMGTRMHNNLIHLATKPASTRVICSPALAFERRACLRLRSEVPL